MILKKERQELIQKAYKELSGKDKVDLLKQKLREIEYIFTVEKSISTELDVYSQIITHNNFVSFDKLYRNVSSNKNEFTKIVKAILDYYSDFEVELNPKSLLNFTESVTGLQIYNPTTGKGQNKSKASGASAWTNKNELDK